MSRRSVFDLSGQAALVTGASRGIGFAIARHFLMQGANVLVNGHDPDETERARADLAQQFPAGSQDRTRIAAFAGNISDPAVAVTLVDEAVGVFGHLDSVVCNAGIDIIKPAVSYSANEWDAVLSVNLKGAFLVAQSAARMWIGRGQRGVSISFTSSIAGSAGISTLAPYAASKGGINQLVRTLAVEWAEHGIRVNAVAPGYVHNIMSNVTAHEDAATQERIRRSTPLGRRATVDEIGPSFVFLASPAASYITGAVLAVDGGYTAA